MKKKYVKMHLKETFSINCKIFQYFSDALYTNREVYTHQNLRIIRFIKETNICSKFQMSQTIRVPVIAKQANRRKNGHQILHLV